MPESAWQFYDVRLALRWMEGPRIHDGTIDMHLSAHTPEHAIARATDAVRVWFRGDIDGASVVRPNR